MNYEKRYRRAVAVRRPYTRRNEKKFTFELSDLIILYFCKLKNSTIMKKATLKTIESNDLVSLYSICFDIVCGFQIKFSY